MSEITKVRIIRRDKETKELIHSYIIKILRPLCNNLMHRLRIKGYYDYGLRYCWNSKKVKL